MNGTYDQLVTQKVILKQEKICKELINIMVLHIFNELDFN